MRDTIMSWGATAGAGAAFGVFGLCATYVVLRLVHGEVPDAWNRVETFDAFVFSGAIAMLVTRIVSTLLRRSRSK